MSRPMWSDYPSKRFKARSVREHKEALQNLVDEVTAERVAENRHPPAPGPEVEPEPERVPPRFADNPELYVRMKIKNDFKPILRGEKNRA